MNGKIRFQLMAGMLAAIGGSASAQNISYKGFLETHTGYLGMGNADSSRGVAFGVSTSHGISIANNFFVGLGAQATFSGYRRTIDMIPVMSFTNDDTGRFIVGFVDLRYYLCKERSWHPFIGVKGGAGYEDVGSKAIGYFSPSLGVSWDITGRFGLDFSAEYSLYVAKEDEVLGAPIPANKFNGVSVSIGIHF
jgi:hypothetical protein